MKQRGDKSSREYQLFEYLHTGLSQRQAQRVEQMLAEDSDLAEEARIDRALDARLDALDGGEFDNEALETQRREIMARLERRMLLEGPTRRKRAVLHGPCGVAAAAAGAALVAVAVTAWFMQTSQPPTRTAAEVRLVEIRPAGRVGPIEVAPRRGVDFSELPLAVEGAEDRELPRGTVVLSFGPKGKQPTEPKATFPTGL